MSKISIMANRVRYIILALTITTVFYLSQTYFYLSKNTLRGKDKTYASKEIHISAPVVTGSPSLKSPLVIVVCDPHGNDKLNQQPSVIESKNYEEEEEEEGLRELKESWDRQAEQTTTLFKSLLYFSKSPKWRIVVITDTLRTFQKVANLTQEFPENNRQRLILEHQQLWYPENYPELAYHWRPCAWAKQFLAECLPDEDAVIYVDSDLVFLGPPEELWWLLTSMGPRHLITVAPEPYYQMEDEKRPYAGRSGLNSGVMAINLTRARELPGGGIGSAILNEGPIDPLPRHDQDALNHFLMDKPHLLLEVSSRWNFVPSACMKGAPPCSDCHSAGILVLHGADMSFYRLVDAKFKVVYSSLVGAPLEIDPQKLLGIMSSQLALADTIALPYPCGNNTAVIDDLTLRLTDEAISWAEKKNGMKMGQLL